MSVDERQMLLSGPSGLVWAETNFPHILLQMLSVLERGPVYHSYHALLIFFSHMIFFQLELLMASVMLQWPDHRALTCRCAPWQPCWLWEHSHPHLSQMPQRGIHLHTAESSHKSVASGCIDLPYRSLESTGLCCDFECLFVLSSHCPENRLTIVLVQMTYSCALWF